MTSINVGQKLAHLAQLCQKQARHICDIAQGRSFVTPPLVSMALLSLRDQIIECNALLQQIQADVNVMGKTMSKLMDKQNDLCVTMNKLLSEHERTSYQSGKRKRGSTLELGEFIREEGAEAADPPLDEDVTQTLVVSGLDWPMLHKQKRWRKNPWTAALATVSTWQWRVDILS